MPTGPQRNATRHREAAAASRAETRRRLIVAAGEEFTQVGFVAATVSRIAARAGVSVQTLYLACGSKRELLRGYLVSTLSGEAPPAEHFAAQVIETTPADVVARIARIFRGVAERSGTAWTLYRDGSAVDPEIAEDWQELQTLRRGAIETLLATIADRDLRLSRADAIDSTWAIASPDIYDLLARRQGYTLDQLENWIATTLRVVLLR